MKATIPYIATVIFGAILTGLGVMSELQLAILTIFFGFVALIDALDELSESIKDTY